MVVLSLVTRNSASRLRASGISLEEVLDSSLQVPFDLMIVVDDSDEGEGTREALRGWAEARGKELVISGSDPRYGRPTRATARQTAIDLFLGSAGRGEEWLLFLDDDVVLNPGWWEEARAYAGEPRVGLIWGYNFDPVDYRRRFLEGISIDYRRYLREVFLGRGGMHDTMLRRGALEEVRGRYGPIPRDLHVFEDAWLCHAVRCLGWEYRIVERGAVHYAPWDPRKSAEVTGRLARLAYRYGFSDSTESLSRYDSLAYALYAWLRPVAGFVPMASVYARQYGWRRGLPAAARRQYDKLRIRMIWLGMRLRGERPGRPCEALAGGGRA
jgi:glycosyltransferase involved in cell wall biosynthesis